MLGSTLLTLSQTPKPDAVDWRTFQPANEEFKIDTPTYLTKEGENDPKESENDAKESRKYYSSVNGDYIYVFSDPLKTPDNLKMVKSFVKSMGKTLDETKASESPIIISFADTYGYWQKIAIIRTAFRIYIAQTVSKDENDPLVDRFIHSFGLGTNRPFTAEKIEITTKDSSTAALVPSSKQSNAGPGNSTGYGQGSGSGSGSGLGSGSGIGQATANPVAHQTSPLKILSKSKPVYTDLARFYVISGTVKTRVTFLASGEIGAVTPVSNLPFGLTEQALAAAKKLKFEPAYNDGNPVAVTKQVEYNFTIY